MSAESSTPGPSDVDQSTFERWRRKFSMITGAIIYIVGLKDGMKKVPLRKDISEVKKD